MAKCSACGKLIAASDASVAACSTCPLTFHKGCVAVPDSTSLSKAWACPECKKMLRKSDNTATLVKSICGHDIPPPNSAIARFLASVPDSTTPKEDENEIRAMRQDFARYMKELREFRNEMVEFRNSVATFGQRLENIENRLDRLEQSQPAVEIKGTAELKYTIAELKSELNEREQESLLSDLEIGCLPENKSENLCQSVILLASNLGIEIEERDVVFVERIGANKIESGTQAAKGPRRQLRDDLLRTACIRRNISTLGMWITGSKRINYINEQLTRINRQLFYRVRQECRKRNWRFFWIKKGHILVRQADGKPAFSIRSENDFKRVFPLD